MSHNVSGDRLDFISTERTATNMPIDWIKIRRIDDDCYSQEVGYIDKCIKYRIYNKKEIKEKIKHLILVCKAKHYEMYGTLFLSYIFEVNPNIVVKVQWKEGKRENYTEENWLQYFYRFFCCF